MVRGPVRRAVSPFFESSMARANRDDFSNQTKRVIASRVSYRCSNPICGAPTCGPTQSPSKHLNIGVRDQFVKRSLPAPFGFFDIFKYDFVEFVSELIVFDVGADFFEIFLRQRLNTFGDVSIHPAI